MYNTEGLRRGSKRKDGTIDYNIYRASRNPRYTRDGAKKRREGSGGGWVGAAVAGRMMQQTCGNSCKEVGRAGHNLSRERKPQREKNRVVAVSPPRPAICFKHLRSGRLTSTPVIIQKQFTFWAFPMPETIEYVLGTRPAKSIDPEYRMRPLDPPAILFARPLIGIQHRLRQSFPTENTHVSYRRPAFSLELQMPTAASAASEYRHRICDSTALQR